ncbi:MAG: LamG-like jellyroll fold domain-containing protein [Pseudomonadota bacterium]|nr:LamG-like jellyroll fold domain-containing protein [Pseudomonadota bacterium]
MGVSAIYFDGEEDAIHSSATSNANLGTNWTVEMHHYPLTPSTVGKWDLLFSNTENAVNGKEGMSLWWFEQKYYLYYTLADGTSSSISTGIREEGLAWYHVAVVNNGANTTLYVNGVTAASVNTTQAHKTDHTAQFNIGGYPIAMQSSAVEKAYTLYGFLDQIRVTHRVRDISTYTATSQYPYCAFEAAATTTTTAAPTTTTTTTTAEPTRSHTHLCWLAMDGSRYGGWATSAAACTFVEGGTCNGQEITVWHDGALVSGTVLYANETGNTIANLSLPAANVPVWYVDITHAHVI